MPHASQKRRALPAEVRTQLDETVFSDFSAIEHWRDLAQQYGENIFQHILHHLVRMDFPPREATRHFENIVGHYHLLQAQLGRPVGLRTATCDYFLTTEPSMRDPVLVESILLRKHEEDAMRDELTGLPNRRAFQRELDREIKRHQRNNRPFSLLMLDVDHFKRVNDQFGHSVGDAVLQHISQQLAATLRSMDFAARYGGEEFAVILPETDASEAMRAAERFRTAVNGAPSPVGTITVSVGSASYPQDAVTTESMVVAADRALYKAKHLGRNRVALAGLEMRRHPRLPIQLPASCRPMEAGSGAILGDTLNVSKGGLLLQTVQPILPRRMVLVFLQLPEHQDPLAVAASPVHHVQAPPKNQLPFANVLGDMEDATAAYHTGLRFVGVDDSTTQALNKLLMTNAVH